MNVVAFIFALIGAGLNLFQPVISVPIPGLGLGASMFDIFLFFMNIISARALQDLGFIVSLLIFALLISVPAQAVKNGIYALQRNKDKNAVGGFIECAAVYVIVALIVFLIPHLASSRAEDRFLMQYGLNNVIPFTTPLIWAACYGVAAILAHTDENSEQYQKATAKIFEPIVGVETEALIKRGNIFLEENNFEQAGRYFEQALNQSPENSQAYLGKLMAELKVHDMDGLGKVSTPLKEQKLFQRALYFANDEEKTRLESYVKAQNKVAEAEKQVEMEQKYVKALEMKEKISLPVDAQIAINLLKSITPYKDSEALIAELEQMKRDNVKRIKKMIILGSISIVVCVVIVVCISKYFDHRRIAQERAEQQRIEQAKIEAEKQEEKSRIEALKLELQGQK